MGIANKETQNSRPCPYKALVDLMGENLSQHDDIESHYHVLEVFITGTFAAGSPIVCSMSREKQSAGDEHLRVHWNRDLLEKEYFKKDLINLIELKAKNKSKTLWSINERELRTLFLGQEDGQDHYMIFEEGQSPFEDAVYDAFEKYLQSSFSIFKKLKGLNRLRSLVHLDDVTGLYNQRKLSKDLDRLVARYEQSGAPFAVLFIDIDHFKKVNDGHGHLIGTQLLSDMAKLIRNVLRESDLIYRYGGDEFVMLLPNATLENARTVGERLLDAVKSKKFVIQGPVEFKLSISIGIASVPEDAKGAKEILEMADKMMYHAKSAGRGRVCLAGEIIETP